MEHLQKYGIFYFLLFVVIIVAILLQKQSQKNCQKITGKKCTFWRNPPFPKNGTEGETIDLYDNVYRWTNGWWKLVGRSQG